jgi:hypothetical protein
MCPPLEATFIEGKIGFFSTLSLKDDRTFKMPAKAPTPKKYRIMDIRQLRTY